MWLLYALLAAVFAALTSIFAKMGIDNISSHLATAIRTVIVLVLAWGIVFALGEQGQVNGLTSRNWLFLVLSGLATGLSWIFYYQAIKIGVVSKVVSIDKLSIVFTVFLAFFILKEPLNIKSVLGCLLIGSGALLMAIA